MAHPRKKPVRKNYYKNSASKQRARKRQRLQDALKFIFGMAAVAGMSFLFVFGYALLTQSSYFSATRLNVDGARRLSSQEVLQQAGLSNGINIFSVNLTMARKRLLSHPWVADAEVNREIPSGINVCVHEHEPLAIIDLNRKFLLNKQGVIFKEWKATDPVDLPVVCGLDFSDLNVDGMSFSRPFNALMSVLKLGQKEGSVVANAQIRKIDVDKDMGLTIHVNSRVGTIKLGYENYANKYKRLQEVLFYFHGGQDVENVQSIDLSIPDRVVVNIKTETSSAMYRKEV